MYGGGGQHLGHQAVVPHHVSPVWSVDDGLEVRMAGQVMSRHVLTSTLIGLHLYLVARREEGVEPHYELRVSLEQQRHSRYDAWSVDGLRFEFLKVQSLLSAVLTTLVTRVFLHDVEEIIVDLGLAPELELDLVQVGEGVLNLQPLEGGRL